MTGALGGGRLMVCSLASLLSIRYRLLLERNI
jgi:hypothetical protein